MTAIGLVMVIVALVFNHDTRPIVYDDRSIWQKIFVVVLYFGGIILLLCGVGIWLWRHMP